MVSVGPAGVITSSWRCSARAERRAAADRTCLLHSLAAAAPRAPRLQSGRREASSRTGYREYTRAIHVTCACSSVRLAAANVRRDFFAVAAHKSETRLNLSRLRWSGWLSQPPLSDENQEGRFIPSWFSAKESTHAMCMHTTCISSSGLKLVLHERATVSPTSSRGMAAVDAAALGGAEQGARRSARTMPSPVRSPPAIQQQD